jgi:glucokinase
MTNCQRRWRRTRGKENKTCEEAHMILAGDIGGTKTILALVSREGDAQRPLKEQTFPSGDYDSLQTIVHRFLEGVGTKPTVASFGVAGPVIGGEVHTTNLPWVISADAIRHTFDIPAVHLLNDLQAVATAVPYLKPDDICTLNTGQTDTTGPIAIIAPGTGLGEAFLIWNGREYQTCATEGGHVSFAPVTHEQRELLDFLEPRFGHVSFERVCSGTGIANLYDYLTKCGRYDEPEWLREALDQANDPTPIIVNAALERNSRLCVATLDLFVRILGGVAGNMALQIFATGGLYLGGGIPPRILPRLQKQDFLHAIAYKGRFRDWVAGIPVHVILDVKAALHGAARNGLKALDCR